jgi:hypothetical protein
VAGVYARSTDRQREALEWIAFALGSEAGARFARELGLIVSPDTLLNCIRGAFRADAENVRVASTRRCACRANVFPLAANPAPCTSLVWALRAPPKARALYAGVLRS